MGQSKTSGTGEHVGRRRTSTQGGGSTIAAVVLSAAGCMTPAFRANPEELVVHTGYEMPASARTEDGREVEMDVIMNDETVVVGTLYTVRPYGRVGQQPITQYKHPGLAPGAHAVLRVGGTYQGRITLYDLSGKVIRTVRNTHRTGIWDGNVHWSSKGHTWTRPPLE